jgi:hypothetical protein
MFSLSLAFISQFLLPALCSLTHLTLCRIYMMHYLPLSHTQENDVCSILGNILLCRLGHFLADFLPLRCMGRLLCKSLPFFKSWTFLSTNDSTRVSLSKSCVSILIPLCLRFDGCPCIQSLTDLLVPLSDGSLSLHEPLTPFNWMANPLKEFL